VHAQQEFTVDIGADVDGLGDFVSGNNLIDLTQINGQYEEIVTIDSIVPADMSGTAFNGTFSTTIFLNTTGYLNDLGAPVAQLATGGLGSNYGLYSMINFTGDFSADTVNSEFSFDNFDGSFDVYFDDINNDINRLTSFNQTTGGLSNDSDDVLLASSSNLTGLGNIGAASAFRVESDDFTLTADGETFFVAPRPFHVDLNASGDITQITTAFANFFDDLLNGGTDNDFVISQTANIRFVPEPSALAILGLGIFGLAFVKRRK
jgi:hypothetical protein